MFNWFSRSLTGKRAPDVNGEAWFNAESLPEAVRKRTASGEPLRFKEEFRGYVVLIEFWTSSCRSCMNTLQFMHKLWHTYRSQKFLIIGVHTPEFNFERDPERVGDAVIRFNLNYPVVSDSEYATWDKYHSKTWPRILIVDQAGKVQYDQAGEGRYEAIEGKVKELLNYNL